MYFHLNKGSVNDGLTIFFVLISSLVLLSDDFRLAGMVSIFCLSFLIFISSLSVQPKVGKNIFLLGVFILFSLIHNYIFSPLTDYASDKRVYFLFVFALVLFLSSYSKVYFNNYNIMFWGLLFVGVVYFFISIGYKPSEDNIRVNELGLNPLILAKNVALLGILALFIPNKKISYILFFVSLVGVIATASRGPFIILIFLLLLSFVLEKRYFSTLLTFILLLFTIIFYDAFLQLMPESFSSRLTSDAFRYQLESDSGSDRIHLFKLAIDILKDHPFFGIGLGNYSYYAPLNAPHNIYLEMFVEMGVFFFLVFLIFIARSVYCGYYYVKKNKDFRLKGLFFVYLFFIFSMLIDGELTIQSFLLYYLGFLFLNLYSGRKEIC